MVQRRQGVDCGCGCRCECPNCPDGIAACCYAIQANGVGYASSVTQNPNNLCVFYRPNGYWLLTFKDNDIVEVVGGDASKTYQALMPVSCCGIENLRLNEVGGGTDYVLVSALNVCSTDNWCTSLRVVDLHGGGGYCEYPGGITDATFLAGGWVGSGGNSPIGYICAAALEGYSIGYFDKYLWTITIDLVGSFYDWTLEVKIVSKTASDDGHGIYRWLEPIRLSSNYPGGIYAYLWEMHKAGTVPWLEYVSSVAYDFWEFDWASARLQWWTTPELISYPYQSCDGENCGWDLAFTTWCYGDRTALPRWGYWPNEITVKANGWAWGSVNCKVFDTNTEYTLYLNKEVSNPSPPTATSPAMAQCHWRSPWIYLEGDVDSDWWGQWEVHVDAIGSGPEPIMWRTYEVEAGTGNPDDGGVIIASCSCCWHWDYYAPNSGLPWSPCNEGQDNTGYNLHGSVITENANVSYGIAICYTGEAGAEWCCQPEDPLNNSALEIDFGVLPLKIP